MGMEFKKGLDFSKMNDAELELFIRTVLNGKKINMSHTAYSGGYAVKHNRELLMLFEPYGIYEELSALTIDTYKGTTHVYLTTKGYGELTGRFIIDFDTYGTVKIFMDIFKITFQSKLPKGVDITKIDF